MMTSHIGCEWAELHVLGQSPHCQALSWLVIHVYVQYLSSIGCYFSYHYYALALALSLPLHVFCFHLKIHLAIPTLPVLLVGNLSNMESPLQSVSPFLAGAHVWSTCSGLAYSKSAHLYT